MRCSIRRNFYGKIPGRHPTRTCVIEIRERIIRATSARRGLLRGMLELVHGPVLLEARLLAKIARRQHELDARWALHASGLSASRGLTDAPAHGVYIY